MTKVIKELEEPFKDKANVSVTDFLPLSSKYALHSVL